MCTWLAKSYSLVCIFPTRTDYDIVEYSLIIADHENVFYPAGELMYVCLLL
jgi:hypothetical protein